MLCGRDRPQESAPKEQPPRETLRPSNRTEEAPLERGSNDPAEGENRQPPVNLSGIQDRAGQRPIYERSLQPYQEVPGR
jgi:hypothetical protein